MSKRVVHSTEDILALLDEEIALDALDPDVGESYRSDLQGFRDQQMQKFDKVAYGPEEAPVPIKSEVEALIGSDGGKLDNYIQTEQSAVSRPLTQDWDFGEVSHGEDFLGSSSPTRAAPTRA